MYLTWVIISLVWAGIIIFKPLIEARRGMEQIVQKMSMDIRLGITEKAHDDFLSTPPISQQDISKRILVAVDGSIYSLHALDYASRLFDESGAMIYVSHVIEWTDEDEESFDSELSKKMEHEGRKMLPSLLLRRKLHCERIVKIGDPGTRIADIANKLDVDIVFLGLKGLGSTSSEMGHVTKKLIGLISKPVVLVS
jgi:nucleotide-binding universal stress UspA family protein